MRIRFLCMLILACTLVACSLSDSAEPRTEGELSVSVEEPTQLIVPGDNPMDLYRGETSLEERIVGYPVVVRAVVGSVTSDVVENSGYDDGKYAVILKLNLTVREYLNGSGNNSITGIWAAWPSYDSRAEAEADRASLVAQRSAPYDDREAIFFLTDDFRIYDAAQASNTYYLGDTKGFTGTWNGTIDVRSMLNRLWLPTNNVGTGDSREYLLALPGSNLARFEESTVSSTSTITLATLKTRIATVNAELNKAGGTTAERRQCLKNKYAVERERHYKKVDFGFEPLKVRNTEHSIASGAPAGTVIFEQWGLAPAPDQKPTTAWLEGDDSSLFEISDGDSLPGDQNSIISGPKGSIVFPQQLTNARPLPGGSYSITVREQSNYSIAQLCSEADSFDWTVSATPQEGATHEFFFDPVTVGNAVAADSSNGVLRPTSFTGSDGASATVESVSYDAGKVHVKVVPWDALSGPLDIIELDGTVSTSLRVANSSVNQGTNTFTWSVSSQPWHDGDRLMVRIRPRASFAPAPTRLTSTAVDDDSVSLSWDSVSGVTGHVVEQRVSNDTGWESVDAKVTDTTYTVSGLSCGTTYEFRVGAYGDGTLYERVTGPTASHYATVSETTGVCATQESPVFVNAAYSFSIVEDAPVGSTVGAVSATDAENDTVTYSITAGNDGEKFAIDGSSGRITLAGTLDHDTDSSHTLTAQADDGNGGKGTATVTVTVEQASCSNGTAVPNPSANSGLVSDCLTLLAARDSLEGAATLNWSSDLAIGNWQGVSVAGTPGRVQSLSLSGLELDGTVPSALSQLSGLQELRLSENRLTGGIPSELGGLTTLQRLSLDYNRLTGSIPVSLGGLSSLHTLALAENALSGSIPVEIGSLGQLRYLSLGGNDLIGSVPSQLGSLSSLRYLYLDQNKLTGGIPTQLGSLSHLEILHLYGNGLTGGIPSELGGLSKLEELALSRNALTGTIPSELERLSKLVYLTLSGNRLTGCIPAGLRSITDNDLNRLGLAYCEA